MKKVWTWRNIGLAPELVEKLQQEFEVRFFRRALEQDPDNVEILVHLGDIFSKRAMTVEGFEIDQRLVRLCPEEPNFHYNLACSFSILGQLEMAYQSLEKAIQLGYQNFEHLKKDADLDNLRKDRRFLHFLKNLSPQT